MMSRHYQLATNESSPLSVDPPDDESSPLSVDPPDDESSPLSVDPPDESSLFSVEPLAYMIAEAGKINEVTIKRTNKLVIGFIVPFYRT